jgi:hypothetical protein
LPGSRIVFPSIGAAGREAAASGRKAAEYEDARGACQLTGDRAYSVNALIEVDKKPLDTPSEQAEDQS